MIAFDKPKHVGYCLSCYLENIFVYSIPMDVSSEALHAALDREFPINGDPLTSKEFEQIFKYVIGSSELCWNPKCNFLIEGMNLR